MTEPREVYPPLHLSGWAICDELFRWLLENLSAGATILELGSGEGTRELAKHYTMFSVEHNPRWVGRFSSTYIYAPLTKGKGGIWYDADIVENAIPAHYDALLVDGPPGDKGRDNFLAYSHLFDPTVLMIFDDVNRKKESLLFENVCVKLRRSGLILGKRRKFGIIAPKRPAQLDNLKG